MKRTVSVLPCLFLAAVLVSCFEDPVEETLYLRFTEDGDLAMRARVELHWLDDGTDNEAFFERMLETETGLLEGWHPWRQRFDRLTGLDEEVVAGDGESWEREAGRLVRWEHWALTSTPGSVLSTVFSDTPLQPQYTALPEGGELSFYAGGGDRATRAERERVEEALEEWSRALAEYLGTTIELWSYLEANPARAVTVVRAMFEDMTEDEVEITDLERDLIERNSDASDEVLTIFELPKDEISTLQEISRKLFDPFPARLLVEVPGTVVAAEGLEPAAAAEGGAGEEGTVAGRLWTVPAVSLWDAYRAIEGVWVAPDPLLTRVRHLMEGGDGDEGFDVDAFLDQEFFYGAAPDRADVRKAVLDATAPRSFYRLEWRSSR